MDIIREATRNWCAIEEALRKYYNRTFESNIPYGEMQCPETLDDFKHIGIVYTELGDDNEYPCQVWLNLVDMTLDYDMCGFEFDMISRPGYAIDISKMIHRESVTVDSLNELLEALDEDDLLSVFFREIPEQKEACS